MIVHSLGRPPREPLGTLLGRPGCLWSCLEAVLGRLEAILGRLGSIVGELGGLLHPLWPS